MKLACWASFLFSFNCIYWKTCQMKVLKWPLCFWWLNMLRVYICHSALSLISFIWLDCLLFPWVKGTENTPLQWACVHATCPFKHARWYFEGCVCVWVSVSVCVCVHFDGCCLCLRSILVSGMDIVILKSYLCIFLPFCKVDTPYLGPLDMIFPFSDNSNFV